MVYCGTLGYGNVGEGEPNLPSFRAGSFQIGMYKSSRLYSSFRLGCLVMFGSHRVCIGRFLRHKHSPSLMSLYSECWFRYFDGSH
jgi:hypothetical protein